MRIAARFADGTVHRADRHYTYWPPVSPLPAQAGPSIGGRSWDLDATVDRPAGAGGVLFATGTENSGVSLFVKDDVLLFDYNFFGEHHVVVSEVPVPVGGSVLGVRFRRTGTGGTAALVIDGERRGEVEIPTVMRVISSVGASIGFDHGSAVSEHYVAPFAFQGTLERLDVQLVTPRPDDAAASEALSIMSRQ